MSIMKAWKCPFWGHLIIMPSLDLECAAHKHWSKYTTIALLSKICKFMFISWQFVLLTRWVWIFYNLLWTIFLNFPGLWKPDSLEHSTSVDWEIEPGPAWWSSNLRDNRTRPSSNTRSGVYSIGLFYWHYFYFGFVCTF